MTTCFVVGGGWRGVVERRVVLCKAKRGQTGYDRPKKGFGADSPGQKEGEKGQGNRDATFPVARRPPEIDEDFVPQGPTMREIYERTGKIQPPQDPSDSVLPEIVSQRMLKRMTVLFSVPFSLAMLGFAGFFYAKTKYDITFQPAVVAFSTLGMFGVALIGLTYGIMSASWDIEKEGSVLGMAEAKTNFLRTVSAVSRSRSREKDADMLKDYDKK
eukprot:Plantae.Rhodophyta-Purpureofilum_apyrenoidigerum.ctg29689.p1 GENE.Plantae.Rhodophyta-Purpureofilum_apyrenoidigerum.ctg29689~~Plantae.Rhodophyta-Purpureofilum_apyrenoidigerum.ctg29689.p1  ORF type:complete len:250 (-),score=42.13 Plantae.Rhodophyta-Purpureofilum_apyrenoidigerum.ctg29689:195-839(-)